MAVRSAAARLHRWVALGLGAWFALLGLSGTALVWHDELDAWLNPAWFGPRPACGTHPTPIAAALDVFARHVGGTAVMVTAPRRAGAAYVVSERRAGGARRQHFVDVHCGLYLGARDWGAARVDRAHLVPAMYELHRALLAGDAGHVAVGIGGLVLLGVTLTGVVLAWPRRSTRTAWLRALAVRRDASRQRLTYDLHRAAGLWLLPFLLLITLTGASLCFPQQGRALVGALLPTLDGGLQPVAAAPTLPVEPDALAAAAQSMWPAARWSRVQLPEPGRALHEVRLRQDGEPRTDTGDTRVRVGPHGALIGVRDALQAPAGETLLGWMFPLHSAEALGAPGRWAWSLFGLAPGLFFATGAWLWWRRRCRCID